MIALVLAMAWSRRGQAVTLALLAMLGVSAAVAAPAYLRAADRAVAAGQVATAPATERSIEIREFQKDHRTDRPGDPSPREVALSETGGTLFNLPGFDYTYAAEYPAVGLDPDTRYRTRFVYRQSVCAHVVVTAGRCLIGEADVIIGEQTARRLKVAVGDSVTLTYAIFDPRPSVKFYLPDGTPKKFLVVGTYRVPDPGAAYWGTNGYFTAEGPDRPGEPAFVGAASLAAMDHGLTRTSIEGVAGPGALDVDRLPQLRTQFAALQAQVKEIGPPVGLETDLGDLLSRIDAGRAAAHLIVPVLAVALVLLACATIFLAVGYGTEGRRPELAVVALRGARWGQRWWLATGENLVAIVAGAVAGCLAGQLLVNAVAAVRFPAVGADPSVASLRYAPVALLAAVLTALLAERRQLVTPVTELLRRAPRVPRQTAAIALAASVAVLAVVAGTQLRISGGSLTGVGTFAAALIVAALAQGASRALLPFATRYARRSLGRGNLGLALAGFQLSRRPGAARLFALLVATVAIVGYAASAVDVAARGRDVQAGLGTGADRVLAVAPVGRQQLLTAVRAVDPNGEFAMAVVKLPDDGISPDGLAVDTSRLAAVASWPDDGPDPKAAAKLLHPNAPAPVTITGADLSLDLTATGMRVNKPVSLAVVLSSTAGLGNAVVPLGDVQAGRHTYRQNVEVCRQGCRINAIRVSEGDGVLDVTGRLILHAINPAAAPTAGLDPGHWRATDGGTITAAPDGLQIDVATLNGLTAGLLVQPADTPYPLPVAVAGRKTVRTVTGLDSRSVPAAPAFHLPAIPGAGTPGTMVDLDYADRLSADAELTGVGQVWLSPKAPPDVLASLEAHGLTIVSDIRAAEVHRALNDQGPALALWFYVIVGCLAAALAAGALILAATVDRPRRVEDLSALRGQGLNRAALRQAALWTYPALIAGAVLAGLAIALLAWWLTGWALPLAGLQPPTLPLPTWPRATVVAATGVVVLVVLACVAYLAGRRTLREVP